MIKKLAAVLMLVFALCSCRTAREMPEYIVHAGGVLWARDEGGVYRSFYGSNSLEGLVNCAERGLWAELDFSFTEDGYLACIHDWSERFVDGASSAEPLTLEEFLSSEVYGIFTPISLDEAAEVLRKYPDLTIVADIKERFDEAAELIAETCPELKDRFVVQIYEAEQYDTVRNLGFERIIYTLYRLTWAEKTDCAALARFAEEHELVGFAFDEELCRVRGYPTAMQETGVPLYVYTVNDKGSMELYRGMGIGVYTDEINAIYKYQK